jgi:hypothetical protein
MSLETAAPLFYNYWQQILALVVCYFTAVYFINLKNPDNKPKTAPKAVEKKKYMTPDQGSLF